MAVLEAIMVQSVFTPKTDAQLVMLKINFDFNNTQETTSKRMSQNAPMIE